MKQQKMIAKQIQKGVKFYQIKQSTTSIGYLNLSYHMGVGECLF